MNHSCEVICFASERGISTKAVSCTRVEIKTLRYRVHVCMIPGPFLNELASHQSGLFKGVPLNKKIIIKEMSI